MRVFSRFKFSTKIIVGIASIVVCIVVMLMAMVSRMSADAMLAESKMRGTALVENLASRSVDPLLAGDLLRLKNMVDELVRLGDGVLYAFVLDEQGRVLSHTFTGGFPVDLLAAHPLDGTARASVKLFDSSLGRIDDFAARVEVAGAPVGTVRVGLSRKRIQAEVRRLVATMAALSLGALVLATALAAVFANTVTRRIEQLRVHAEEIVKGELDLQAGPTLARNCWQIMGCDHRHCPAYGDERRRCWYVAGTLCPNCDHGEFPAKRSSCHDCPVYQENVGDEIQDLAETFDVMAITLQTHIGELKEAERVLSEQQRLMRTILNATPDLVSLVDTRMIYQAANKAFADFVSMTPQQVQGKTDFDLFPEAEAEKRHLESRDILVTGERLDKEAWVRSGEAERWFHTVSIPVTDQQGKVVGLLRTDRDLTELKRFQEQLIQAQKMESLGKLAGGVAHEINTPLGIILGYAQLLMEDVEEDGQVHQDLATIAKQAKVCRKIVADLLGFSRQHESAKIEMCFNNSVREAVSLVRHSFEMDRVVLEDHMDDRMPIIYGDPEKLKQVWINLLNNARQAMKSGGVILVKTALDTPNQKVTLWVADTGIGIDKAGLQKIFDPFYTTKPVGEGTGLGLSVSFGIVEDHGGEIRAESPLPPDFRPAGMPEGVEPGPGTVFIVDLPLDHQGESGNGGDEQEREKQNG